MCLLYCTYIQQQTLCTVQREVGMYVCMYSTSPVATQFQHLSVSQPYHRWPVFRSTSVKEWGGGVCFGKEIDFFYARPRGKTFPEDISGDIDVCLFGCLGWEIKQTKKQALLTMLTGSPSWLLRGFASIGVGLSCRVKPMFTYATFINTSSSSSSKLPSKRTLAVVKMPYFPSISLPDALILQSTVL